MGNVSQALESAAEDLTGSHGTIIGKKITHGCNLFMQDESARQAFVEFIQSGSWVNDITADTDLLDNLKAQTEGRAVHNYILPDGQSAEDIKKYFKDPEAEDPASGVPEKESSEALKVIESCFSHAALRPILLASVFPLFLESPEYKQWVDANTSASAKIVFSHSDPETKQDRIEEHKRNREQRLDELFDAPSQRRVRDIVSTAMKSCDGEELTQMLMAGDWLQNLLASVEDLSLCVTLATARKERWGFPLVYVNKAFEKVTQYGRDEIVGKNCNFLQSGQSEPEQVAKLTVALANAQPVKVVLTNTRKDGSEFVNMLAMKPVFDEQGVYSYVIGVQYDVTNTEASFKQIKQVNDLLSILPNILN